MSTILKFDFQKRKKKNFAEENDLNYRKKDIILHVTIFSLKQGQTRTSSRPISNMRMVLEAYVGRDWYHLRLRSLFVKVCYVWWNF